MACVSMQRLHYSLFCVLLSCGMVQVVAHSEKVEIGVTNWLTDEVVVKVSDSQGAVVCAQRIDVEKRAGVEAKSSARLQGTDSSECGMQGNANVILASNSHIYSQQRPWFVWLQMHMNASVLFEFVHDPFVASPSYRPGVEMGHNHWEIYGKGIFYTRNTHNPKESTEQQAKAQVTTQLPTLFCFWDESSAPSHDCIQPAKYKTYHPLHPCSAYSGSWNPAWLSVANELAKGVEVTVKKWDDSPPIKLVASGGTPEWPSYSDKMISPKNDDYGKQSWTIVVRGYDYLLRNVDITLIKPMGLEPETQRPEATSTRHGWVLHVSEWGISFAHNGLPKEGVCVWKVEDETQTIYNCRSHGQVFVL